MLQVSIITQEDSFVIPNNIELLLKENGINIISIYTVGKGAMTKKRGLFIKGFGFCQSAKMGTLTVATKLINGLDLLFFGKLPCAKKSIKAVAKKHRILYGFLPSICSHDTMEELQKQNLDLIISFSAPCIFPPELLALPKHGCLNLHCSLLPLYAGLLPSFWTLYHGEKTGGATVHYMDDKIDNGDILGQVSVDITDCESMYQVIRKTKQVGGKLMIDILRQIGSGTVQAMPNISSKENYFTWPTVEQMRNFRKKGGRLI